MPENLNTSYYSRRTYKLGKCIQGTSADSTSKYFELAYNLKDSTSSATKRNDIASTSFDEETRQKELLARREKDREERKRNIQFATIGIGLISFIILSLLLSRSIIVKSGLVRKEQKQVQN